MTVGVGVGVPVGVGVGVGTGVGVGVGVGLTVGDGVGVTVDVGVDVGVGEADVEDHTERSGLTQLVLLTTLTVGLSNVGTVSPALIIAIVPVGEMYIMLEFDASAVAIVTFPLQK